MTKKRNAGASKPETFDVAVIGAGPLGQIAALSLADIGHNVALIGPQAPDDTRTTAILMDGIKRLSSLDVWSSLAPKIGALKTMRLVDGSRRLIRAPETRFDASEVGLEAFGYNIRNRDLNEAFTARIAGDDRIRKFEEFLDADPEFGGSSIRLSLPSGVEIDASFVVAADGRRSKLREALQITARTWSYPQTALVMSLAHSRPHNNVSTEFHTETGPFTLVPLEDGKSSLVWVERPETALEILSFEPDRIAAAIEKKSHFLLGDVTVESDVQTYPMTGLIATRFGDRGIALVGEAGHVFPPIGAQGMNLGFRDIEALLHLVTRGGLDDPVGMSKRYSTARMGDVSARTGAVDILNRSLLTDFLPVHLTRGLALHVSSQIPFLRQLLMRQGLGARA
ncbi:MAG: UbiH/UbiF family hydroxylase [Pseudomonadota bacterium]